ncbi:hypothetical protein PoHVEF18_009168 [Penicillium ochrochloron]
MEAAAPYAISATDRSGLIVIVETLFMSWMIMVSLIRLYMRLAINGPVQIDDLVVFAGSIFAIAHVGTVMNAISHGLGRTQYDSSSWDLKRAGEGIAWKSITAFDVITDVLTFGLSIFLVWGIQMRWKDKATGVTNSNGEHPYFTPTGKSASTTQSRAFTSSKRDEDEADLAATRLSHDSQNSRQLIIHQTQEWIVEEEYEMH